MADDLGKFYIIKMQVKAYFYQIVTQVIFLGENRLSLS